MRVLFKKKKKLKSQGNWGRKGTMSILLYHFNMLANIQIFTCSFASEIKMNTIM